MSKRARKFCVVGTMICINLMVSSAWAAFNFTAQTRSVTAHINGPGAGTQTLTASDFALFDQTASVTDNNGGSAGTHQRSELLSNAINIVESFGGSPPVAAGSGQATGSAQFSTTFTVPSTTDVDLSAQASFHDDGFPYGSISLTGPGTSVTWYVIHTTGGPPVWPVGDHFQHLTLGPGSYTLNSNISGHADAFGLGGRSSGGSVTVALSVPEPASSAAIGLLLLSLGLRRSPKQI
jgi:hypothetical protein